MVVARMGEQGASCKVSVFPGHISFIAYRLVYVAICAMLRLTYYLSPCPSLLVFPSMMGQIPVSLV